MPYTSSLTSICASRLLALAWLAPAAAPGPELEVRSITRAPIAPDGTTAGAPTDFVVTFVDRDPAVDGLAVQTGGFVSVFLPEDFVIHPSEANSAVPLQGWPQSPPGPPPSGNFTATVDARTNTITIVMNVDLVPGGEFGPGLKQVHLILLASESPRPGSYPIGIAVDPDGMRGPEPESSAVGFVRILPRTRPSINAVSLFSGPPGPPPPFFNPLYQTVPLGEPARQVGFYLWGKDSRAAVGVDLVMTSQRHGRLVDLARNKSVGQVWIRAPHAASDFSLTTTGPSVESEAFITGVPVGVLTTQFTPDPAVVGNYAILLRMNGGNTERLSVSVIP